MNINFTKYQGTGNDFVMIDNRNLVFPKSKSELIQDLCNRRFGIGADGLILLELSTTVDFKMVYFNADGNEGSMCGNGGRCIVAFAKELGIIHNETTFEAVDGMHYAKINDSIVSLKMIDVSEFEEGNSTIFLDTGSPHHIEFCNNIDQLDVKDMGSSIRYSDRYIKNGTNVNFVEQIDNTTFKVRTYERGVEDETLACGTGVTAVALAANKTKRSNSTSVKIEVVGGQLEVSFDKNGINYSNIYLKGPAKLVFEGSISYRWHF